MTVHLVLAHALLPASVAAAAGWGAWRCWRLLRYGRDPRLVKLTWFYALFAASLLAMAIWMGQLAGEVAGSFDAADAANMSGLHRDLHNEFVGAERVDAFLLAHHALMLASLGVAVKAFSHKAAGRGVAAALVGVAFLAPFIRVALAVEAAMTLYLAIHAIVNHMERRTRGALQVAAGFALFFIGHLGVLVFHEPGMGRIPLGDVFTLVGIVLLVQLLPRPSA